MNIRIKTTCMMALGFLLGASTFAGNNYTASPRYGGGYNIYDSRGLAGRTTPTYGGGYRYSSYRGEMESNLFSDKEFSSRFDESLWLEAVSLRNVGMMAEAAWSLKGVETMLGKVDKTTTSEKMFASAAEIAVAQKNEAGLKEIIALSPACKKYAEEMKLAGSTRGSGYSLVNMPELVTFPSNPRDPGANPSERIMKKIGELKQYQAPVFTNDIITMQFRGVTTVKADNISVLVNQGRMTLNPKMLALGALELADLKAEGEVSRAFDAKVILQEAAELAFQLNDNEALSLVMQIYQGSKLKDPEKAKLYQEQIKTMAATRGGDVSSPMEAALKAFDFKSVEK